MKSLKLIAFDADDLAVISAHLQDAVLKVADMTFLPREKRFAAVLRRFDWERATKGTAGPFVRQQAAIRFERVLRARHQGLETARKGGVLCLLAVQYEPRSADDPAGIVRLTFAGGGAVQLEVECLEAELRDLGPTWRARSRPVHPDADSDRDRGSS